MFRALRTFHGELRTFDRLGFRNGGESGARWPCPPDGLSVRATSAPSGGVTKSDSALILYQSEDGRTRIQCRFEDETIWLSQAQLSELFQTSVPNINIHLKAIYAEEESTVSMIV